MRGRYGASAETPQEQGPPSHAPPSIAASARRAEAAMPADPAKGLSPSRIFINRCKGAVIWRLEMLYTCRATPLFRIPRKDI